MDTGRGLAATRGWPSVENVLAGLAFASPGGNAEPTVFAQALMRATDLNSGDPLDLAQERIADFVRAFRVGDTGLGSGELTQESALRILLARDAHCLLELLEQAPDELLDVESVGRGAVRLKALASDLGMDAEFAELRVVDAFPAPYSSASFAAMTYDTMDQKLYGMTPGVVLKRSQLRPLYSLGLLAHEFVHVLIGRVETEILARGLEEGVADIVGQIVLGSHLVPPEIAKRLVWNSRFRYGRDQLGRLYRDSFVAACALSIEVGTEGLMAWVRRANQEGREVMHTLERALVQGTLARDAGHEPHEVDSRRFFLRCLAMTPDLVVSPLAKVLAQEVRVGETLAAVQRRVRISSGELKEAFAELQERVFVSVVSDGTVTSNEGPFYSELGQLRYDPGHERA